MNEKIKNYPLVDYFESSASSVLKKDAQKQLDQPQEVKCVQRSAKKRQNRRSTIKGCEKASVQLAIRKRDKLSNRYNQNGQEVPILVELSYFKKYGSGIFLFFHFAKYLSIFFVLAAIISLCPIIYNMVQGDNLSSIPSTSGTYLAKTCLANLGDGAVGVTSELSLSTSKIYKMVNNLPDIVISFGFLIFYIFWEIKSDKLTDEVKQEVKFMSFYTIEVKFAKENIFTEEQIAIYFSKFGRVNEVAPVKNYQDLIFKCKQLYSLQISKKQLIIENENEQDLQEKKKGVAKIQKLKDKINEMQNSMLKQIKQKEQIFKYYVVFETIKQRKNALKALKQGKSCCSKKNEDRINQIEMKGEEMNVTGCHNEPSDIIWENQHITWHNRIWRNIIQFILVIALLWVTFSVISFLNIATPSTSTSLDVSSYTVTTIQTETNGTILYVWCVLHKDMMESNSSIDSLCSNYINKYYLSVFIGILISMIIVVVKTILKKIVIYLSKFQRYHQFTEQSIDMIKKLFFTYLCTTILITLFLQANIFGLSIKRIIKELIKNQYLLENVSLAPQYSDFVPFWYVDIGYKLFLTLFILAIQAPLIGPIAQFAIQKFKIWKAQNALIQKQAQDLLIFNEFEIEDHYANILLIIFVGMTFSAGMPVMYLCCSIAFALRYFYFRFIFIRYSKLPKSYDEALNQSVINFLPFALIMHYFFGIWMYGTESIFIAESSIFDSWVNDQSIVWQSLGFILRRFGNSSYYTICFFISLGVMLIKIIAYDLIFQNIKDIEEEDKVPTIALQNNQEAKGQNKMTAQCSITTSYRIQNNQNYFEVLAIFEKLKKMQVNVGQ